ncbi:hypothetical protein [Planomonospora algeriensis]
MGLVIVGFASMLRTAPGIGVRHFNDYAGTIIVTTLIGTLGTEALAACVVAAPWLVAAFATPEMDRGLARLLLFGFLIAVPVYLLQHSFGEMLTVHQRAKLLSAASTAVRYGITVPFAAVAVFLLESPFLAVTGYAVSSPMIALIFWRAVEGHHREAEVAVA